MSDKAIINIHYAIGCAEERNEFDPSVVPDYTNIPTNIGSLPFKIIDPDMKIIIANNVPTVKERSALARAEHLLIERKWNKLEEEIDEMDLVEKNEKRRQRKKRKITKPLYIERSDSENEDIIEILKRTELTREGRRTMHTIEEPEPTQFNNGRFDPIQPDSFFNSAGDFGSGISNYQSNLDDWNSKFIRDGASGQVRLVDKDHVLQPTDSLLKQGQPVMPPFIISERDRIALTPAYRERFNAQFDHENFVRPDVIKDIYGAVVIPPEPALDNNLNKYFHNCPRMIEANKKIEHFERYERDLDDSSDDEDFLNVEVTGPWEPPISREDPYEFVRIDRMMDMVRAQYRRDYEPPVRETATQFTERMTKELFAKIAANKERNARNIPNIGPEMSAGQQPGRLIATNVEIPSMVVYPPERMPYQLAEPVQLDARIDEIPNFVIGAEMSGQIPNIVIEQYIEPAISGQRGEPVQLDMQQSVGIPQPQMDQLSVLPKTNYLRKYGRYRIFAALVIQTMENVCRMVTDFEHMDTKFDDFNKKYPYGIKFVDCLMEMDALEIVNNTYIVIKKE